MTELIDRITIHCTFAVMIGLNKNSLKRWFLLKFSFVCFPTFMVQNLPVRRRKTEKNKEVALTSFNVFDYGRA
jgi:hypothetical protein